MGAPAVQHFGWKGRALHWLAVAADTGFIPGNGGTGSSDEESIRLVAAPALQSCTMHRRPERQQRQQTREALHPSFFRFARSSRSCLPGLLWLDINVKLDMHFGMHADRTINAAICCSYRYRLPWSYYSNQPTRRILSP